MNDFADLTDVFNAILSTYLDGEQVVDFDSWSIYDIIELMGVLEQVLELLGEEYADHYEISPI